MDKTLLEELKEARISNEDAYVIFFNNGKSEVEKRCCEQNMNEYAQEYSIRRIGEHLKDIAESFGRHYAYDTIHMGLEIGLIYNKNDVLEENKIPKDKEPLSDIVRFSTKRPECFLNGEKSNTDDYFGYDKQGFINYNVFVKKMEKNGLEFNGPKSFEEFKELILTGEPFDINLVASLTDTKENEVIEEVKEEPKKLIKKSFFRRR